jgi:DNA-binding XRE family transcriptional regulator
MVLARATHHAQRTGISSQTILMQSLRRNRMTNPKSRKPNQVKGIDYDGMNQQEVADALGITRTAVQQIEKRAYKKFRRELAKKLKHIADLL